MTDPRDELVQDACIAEAVGYEAWEKKNTDWKGRKIKEPYRVMREPREDFMRTIESLKGDGYKKVALSTWANIEGLAKHLISPPFITASTPSTEHIVFLWMRSDKCTAGQHHEIHDKLHFILRHKISGGYTTSERSILEFGIFLDHYQMGDYALAVLEVLKDGKSN